MKMRKVFSVFSACAMAASVSACGTSYLVTKVDGEKIPTVLPKQGIYYALPKTEVVVGIPISATTTKTGKYFGKFEKFLEACKAGPIKVPDVEKNDVTPATSYKPGQVRIYTRAVPDMDHRYMLNVDADAFSSFSHTVELTEGGLLTSANSTVADGATAAVLATVDKVVEIAATVTGFGTGPLKESLDDFVDCKEIRNLEGKRQALERELAVIEQKREQLLLVDGLKASSDTLQKALDLLDRQATGVMQKREYKDYLEKVGREKSIKTFGAFKQLDVEPKGSSIDRGKDSTNKNQNAVAKWDVVPLPDAKAMSKDPLSTVTVPGTKIIEALPIQIAKELIAELDKWKVEISVEPNMEYDLKCSKKNPEPNCSETLANSGDGGYRYRLPALGKIIVKGNTGNGKNIVAHATTPIAQYGPIAQLPSYFGGLEGNVELEVFTDTGALKKVTVGAKPQSPDTIAKFGDIALEQLNARAARKQAEAAVEDGAELNALKREKETLELRKAIRDLRKDLGEAEASN